MRIVKKAALSLVAALGFVVALGVTATPAYAQATRTWVSGVGDDANPCSRTAPCKTFAGAISKTAAGGEIDCLDPGGFGAVTITKSITIYCEGLVGGIAAAGTNGVIINAGANDRVVLRGLDIDGYLNASSQSGVRILSARDVVIIDSNIRGFINANSAGVSVDSGAVKVRVTISNTNLIGNTYGVKVISSGGQGNANITNSLFTANITAGVQVSGAGNRASVSGNAFYGSPKALELLSGGVATSFGNNAFGTTATDAPTVTPLG